MTNKVGNWLGLLKIYDGPWWLAPLAIIALSIGVMLYLQHREGGIPPLSQQYPGFIFGDSICLPLIAIGNWLMTRDLPDRPEAWYRQWWFHLLVLVLFFGFGMLQNWGDIAQGKYTSAELFSPAKFYHNFVLFPLAGYLVVTPLIPNLFYSDTGLRGGLSLGLVCAGLGVLGWAGLGIWDLYHPNPGR